MEYNKEREERYPHSPCLWERDESDGRFSKGWGSHFKTSELYFADVHKHITCKDISNIEPYVDAYFKAWDHKRIKQFGLILPPTVAPDSKKDGNFVGLGSFKTFEENQPYLEFAKGRKDITPMIWPHYENPNLDFVKKSIENGAKGVKLHNAHILMEGGNRKEWFSDEWDKVFSYLDDNKIPILFHVTQRLTPNLYGLGGRNSYWKQAWEKGVTFTNQDLMDDYIELIEKYPNIPFIGAHQLHLGWDKLADYFDKYPNFNVDTSVGCTVLHSDRMYEDDINELRAIFIKYHDRILFGTDECINDKEPIDSVPSAYHTDWEDQHIRFMRQLDLPFDELQNIAHGNFNRLFGVEKLLVGVE